MEKYGFVYLWFDRKHKRYYVGCHWGTEDDGYICSSPWMKQAYKRRPHDFKRRILKRVHTSKKDLFEAEMEYLSLIKEEEIRKRYYNLNIKKNSHWSSDENKRLTISEKIKRSHNTPETKKKLSESKMGDKNPMRNPEVAKKVANKNRGREAPNKGIPCSEEQKKRQSITMKNKYKNGEFISWNKGKKLTDEEKKNNVLANRKMSLEKTWYCNKEKNQMIRINNDEIPPDGFVKGRLSFAHTPESKKKIGDGQRGVPKEKKYGWITNEIEDKRFLQGLTIPKGWRRGRKKKCM